MARRMWWVAVPVLALLVWGMSAHGHDGHGTAADSAATASASGGSSASASHKPGGSASPSADGSWYHGSYTPSQFAPQVRTRAAQAGVDPQLVMAILYNEDYKPHDPSFEREWQKLKPGAAFGIANMHEATFDEVKRGRSFADRSWTQLPDDPDLAIQAEAWYLHDLKAQLPAHHVASLTTDELLALGYNTGPGNMRLFAQGTKLGSQAQSYLDELRGNWPKAASALHD